MTPLPPAWGGVGGLGAGFLSLAKGCIDMARPISIRIGTYRASLPFLAYRIVASGCGSAFNRSVSYRQVIFQNRIVAYRIAWPFLKMNCIVS